MTSLPAKIAVVVTLVVGVSVVGGGSLGALEVRGDIDVLPLGSGSTAPAPGAVPSEPAGEPTDSRARESEEAATTGPAEPGDPTEPPRGESERRPLRGQVVVLDPGHQLGNGRFPDELAEPVEAGGFTKPCNTTGTSTDAGYPEATFVWEVALRVREVLERKGARVVLTRDSNSSDEWGPCVDVRGRAGNPGESGPTADAKLSIHADGTFADGAHGFHVIAPGNLEGYTDDIGADSLDLAVEVRDRLVANGFVVSTYTAEDGIDVRTDLGTLNLADVPTVMVELGNMRNPAEADVMASGRGQRQYAKALARGLTSYLQ